MKNIAYIDGSFNAKKDICGAGAVFFDSKGTPHYMTSHCTEENMTKMRNVGGEIASAIMVIKHAYDIDMKDITIYYDYEGIEKWITGDWKAINLAVQAYVEFVKDIMSKGLQIKFVKVKAHSGDQWNDAADQLAKEACGCDSVSQCE